MNFQKAWQLKEKRDKQNKKRKENLPLWKMYSPGTITYVENPINLPYQPIPTPELKLCQSSLHEGTRRKKGKSG